MRQIYVPRRFQASLRERIDQANKIIEEYQAQDYKLTLRTRRLEQYAGQPIQVRRVALTISQVRRHRLPPNVVKQGDANSATYRREFGTSQCWELDALSPTVITSLIRSEVEGMIDDKAWASAKRREQRHCGELKRLVGQR